MNPKRAALWFLIVSVVLSAVSGIVAIVSGTFGDLQARIVLTTLTISAASLCALACGAFWESAQVKILPASGIALAVITAAIFIFGIWTKISSDDFWKAAASVGIVAAATAHACLLSLARLAKRFTWSRLVTFAAIYLLAALFIYVIYAPTNDDTILRIIGVNSIVVAALTILTPIFHRLSRSDLKADARQDALHKTITCPRCGSELLNSSSEINCARCGCVFLVTILNSPVAASVQQ